MKGDRCIEKFNMNGLMVKLISAKISSIHPPKKEVKK